MRVSVSAPAEFQGTVIGLLNKRKGTITNSEVRGDDGYVEIEVEVPLNEMFGYSTDLRSVTQGKGEFSMEVFCCTFSTRAAVSPSQSCDTADAADAD